MAGDPPESRPRGGAHGTIPRIKPSDALEYFRSKGMREGFHWQDVWQEEHARAFTVAKAMNRDVLETIRAAVDDAIYHGETLRMFEKKLTPLLQAKGWWGKQWMTDPATGERKLVQLGSPRRLKIIFDTNIRMAMRAGDWKRYVRNKDTRPYLKYSAIMDERTRPQHAEWNGTILPVDHPWWDTHYPPCGWNCRCTTISYSDFALAQAGLEVSKEPPPAGPPREFINSRTGEVSQVPDGIDPGFAYNVGKAWLGGIAPPPLLPPDLPELEAGIDIGKVPAHAPEPASLLPADVSGEEAVGAFLDGVGVPRAAVKEGAIIYDAENWPLAVSDAWFRDEGGKPLIPSGERRRVLGLVGKAIRAPSRILWRWVKGKDGKSMLFRRYLAQIDGLTIAVDVGRGGWRFASERDAGFDLAKLIQGGTSASLGEGGAFGGKAGELKVEAYVAAAMGGASNAKALSVGTYGEKLAARLADFGFRRPARIITLEASYAKHIVEGHGQDADEQARGQLPVDIVDIGKIAAILGAVDHIERGSVPKAKRGGDRFKALASFGGRRYTLILEARRAGIGIVTMWKR